MRDFFSVLDKIYVLLKDVVYVNSIHACDQFATKKPRAAPHHKGCLAQTRRGIQTVDLTSQGPSSQFPSTLVAVDTDGLSVTQDHGICQSTNTQSSHAILGSSEMGCR